MGPAVVGTIVITGVGRADGHAARHPRRRLPPRVRQDRAAWRQVLRFFADVMTGVPSIVMGLFIFTIWVVRFGVDGVTGFAGALALGCLMLPIIIRSTEEMLQAGARRPARGQPGARVEPGPHDPDRRAPGRRCPASCRGVLLAVARAAGETAPLLFTIGAATSSQLEPVQRPEHRAVRADLHQRPAAVRRRPGAGLGRGADAIVAFILLVLSRVVAARSTRRGADDARPNPARSVP